MDELEGNYVAAQKQFTLALERFLQVFSHDHREVIEVRRRLEYLIARANQLQTEGKTDVPPNI